MQRTRKKLEESDFISFGLMNEQRKLSYAGVLFSDQCPLLQSRIFCTRWNGLDKTSIFEDAVDDREYSGNLIMLLENGFNFIKNHNRKAWKKLPRVRVEYNDYNERVITEVLVNALIHRMYDIMGAEIHIDIYDDRLEIWSPGGMYDGSEIQNREILKVPSVRRNPVIADVFQRLDFMERRGSGFKKIYEALEHKEKIEFFSDRTGFKVTMVNENYNRKTDTVTDTVDKPAIIGDKPAITSKDKIIKYLEANDYITTNIATEILELKSKSWARDILSKMVKENILLAEGANKNRIYKLTKKY